MSDITFDLDSDDDERLGDAFLRLDLTVCDSIDLGAVVGAEPFVNSLELRLRNAVIVALMLVAFKDPERWVIYSRDKSRYTGLSACFGKFASYRRMMRVVESLETAELVDHRKTRPSPTPRFSSTLRARPSMMERIPIRHTDELHAITPNQFVRLKNKSKALIAYRPTRETNAWHNDVAAQNLALQAATVSFDAPCWQLDPRGLWRKGKIVLNPVRSQLYRVFNENWFQGGRWYGGWWQGLPSKDRQHLHIDGKNTVELDYEYHHARLLAAAFGIELGNEDPYIIEGFDRRLIKLAFNIMLNVDAGKSPVAAVRDKFRREHVPEFALQASKAVDAITTHHRGFERAWGTGVGRQLQAIDGEMCAVVQRRLRDAGHVALSVHDSFIVIEEIKQLLIDNMVEALEEAKWKLSRNGLQ